MADQRWIPRIIAGGAALAVLAATFFVLRANSAPSWLDAEAERLRGRIVDLRARADACLSALDAAESRFEAYNARVDSLRATVRAFEALDSSGVPAERYERYLDAFDDYNAAVPLWHDLADSLRTRSAECRALGNRHNRLLDSLNALGDAPSDPVPGPGRG